MEKDTVVLSLKDYNELREFKNSIEKGDVLISVKMYRNGAQLNTYQAKLYTKETTIKMLTDANENLREEIDRLLKQLYPEDKELTLKDIKKMSYWEFRKWKKSN